MDVLATLNAHSVYLSEADEAELMERVLATDDVSELALRTCLCGARIEGFDSYTAHLHDVLTATR